MHEELQHLPQGGLALDPLRERRPLVVVGHGPQHQVDLLRGDGLLGRAAHGQQGVLEHLLEAPAQLEQ